MAEGQIALMVVAINIGVMAVVLFAAYCINRLARRVGPAPRLDTRQAEIIGEPRL